MTEEQFDKLVSGISRVAYVKSFSRKPSEEFPFHQFVINLNEDDAYHTHIQVIDAELRQLGFEYREHPWKEKVRSYYLEIREQ